MTGRSSVISLLWTPSKRRVSLKLRGDADTGARRLGESVDASEEVSGRVSGRGVKIERHPDRAARRGAFGSVFYGVVQGDGEDCRLVGHFQIHPVGRLFIAVWIVLSTVLALALLSAGAMRATPESAPEDALPFLIPALLPFFGFALAYWQRRRGRDDESSIRCWLDGHSESRR